MASTFTIRDAINFTKPYIVQQSLFVNNQQPALGAAQVILNTILGPPFSWRTNRTSFSFAIAAASGTDYPINLPNLGHIETQWLLDGSGKKHELRGAISLPVVSTSKLPTMLAPQYDDNAGNITMRFNSVPDQAYTAFLDYQQKAPWISGTAQPLGTLADENADVFFLGFLTWAAAMVKDARFPIFDRMFTSRLLSRQDGLDDQARSIFLGEWLTFTRAVQRSQGAATAGVAGRNQ